MKEITLKDLEETVNAYCRRDHREKPLLVWFNSNPQLDNFKREFLKRNDVLAFIGERIMPFDVSSKTSILLCHRYVGQMDVNALTYCMEVFNQYNLPLVYLANDYSFEAKTNLVDENFEQVKIVYGNPKHVVLISCGKSLKGMAQFAHEIYYSSIFKKSWEYANSLKPDLIFILSTKHKLLNPYDIIEGYDYPTPLDKWEQWSNTILQQLREKGIDVTKDKITILAGENYCKYLRRHITNLYEPLKGLSFGYRLQVLNKLIQK